MISLAVKWPKDVSIEKIFDSDTLGHLAKISKRKRISPEYHADVPEKEREYFRNMDTGEAGGGQWANVEDDDVVNIIELSKNLNVPAHLSYRDSGVHLQLKCDENVNRIWDECLTDGAEATWSITHFRRLSKILEQITFQDFIVSWSDQFALKNWVCYGFKKGECGLLKGWDSGIIQNWLDDFCENSIRGDDAAIHFKQFRKSFELNFSSFAKLTEKLNIQGKRSLTIYYEASKLYLEEIDQTLQEDSEEKSFSDSQIRQLERIFEWAFEDSTKKSWEVRLVPADKSDFKKRRILFGSHFIEAGKSFCHAWADEKNHHDEKLEEYNVGSFLGSGWKAANKKFQYLKTLI